MSEVSRKKDVETKPGEQEWLPAACRSNSQGALANKTFEVNNSILRQLMCGHLELCGPEIAKAHHRLRQLIDLDAKDGHLVGTNRRRARPLPSANS